MATPRILPRTGPGRKRPLGSGEGKSQRPRSSLQEAVLIAHVALRDGRDLGPRVDDRPPQGATQGPGWGDKQLVEPRLHTGGRWTSVRISSITRSRGWLL